MKPIPTVGVLIYKDDAVLMVRHGPKASHLTGSYGVPAGRLEEGESKLQAAVRELHEETGLVTHESDLVQLQLTVPPVDLPRKDGTTKRFMITLFYCLHYIGELSSSEETIPEWVQLTKLDDLPLIGMTKQIVEEGLQEIKSKI